MREEIWFLSILAAIGSGLIAGVFYAFSTFVMKALARLPAREGIVAMQSINIAVINPAFLGVFVGSAIACAATMLLTVLRWESPRSIFLCVGALFYLVGTFGVTMWCNVPLNNVLAKLEPNAADSALAWNDYLRRWTLWNHCRAIAALIATILMLLPR